MKVIVDSGGVVIPPRELQLIANFICIHEIAADRTSGSKAVAAQDT
jgi:hypothetical protein